MRSIFLFFLLALFLLSPLAASAACTSSGPLIPSEPPESFSEIVCLVTDNISTLFPIIIGITLIIFGWGLAKMIRSAGDETSLKEGKTLMIWGIVGLFVMLSVWGIIRILYSSIFGGGTIGVPLLPTE